MFSFIFHLPSSLGIDFQQTLLEKAAWISHSRSEQHCWCLLPADHKVSVFIPSHLLALIRDSNTMELNLWGPASDRAAAGWWQLFMTLTIAAALKCVLLPHSSGCPPSYLPCVLQSASSLFLPPWDRGLRVLEYHQWLPDLGFLLHHCFYFFASWAPACSVRAKPEGNGSSCSQLDLEVWEFENRFFLRTIRIIWG